MRDHKVVTAAENDFETKYSQVIYDPLYVTSAICVPLIVNGSVKGAIEYINKLDSDRFSVRDRLLLTSMTAFIEFHLFVGSLKNRTYKTMLHLKIDHEKFKRAMKICKHEHMHFEDLKKQTSMEERLGIPSDQITILCSIDQMFYEVVDNWRDHSHYNRLRFLSNIFTFTQVHSPIVWKKIWSSLDFIYSILKTYLIYFTNVERELMMYTMLCHEISSPYCNIYCIKPEVSTEKPDKFQECNTFYFIRSLFEDSKLFENMNTEPLMRKLNVTLHSMNAAGMTGIKEKLFKIIARKQIDLNDIPQRIWIRTCLLYVADQAIYFRPDLLPFEEISEYGKKIFSRNNPYAYDQGGRNAEDVRESLRDVKDISRLMALHLKINVLPLLILMRAYLPESKIYLIHCLQSIKSFQTFKMPKTKQSVMHDMKASETLV